MAKSPNVPLLEFATDTSLESKKKDLNNRNQYNAVKFGAGYKPRFSDLERWHLYKVNENQYIPNYACSFHFFCNNEELLISKCDVNGELENGTPENNENPKNEKEDFPHTPHLNSLDDKFTYVDNKIHYKTLDEFNIKKFNQMQFHEWECSMILSIGEKMSNSKESKEGKRIPIQTKSNKLIQIVGHNNLEAHETTSTRTTLETINDLLTEEEKKMKRRSRSNLIPIHPKKDIEDDSNHHHIIHNVHKKDGQDHPLKTFEHNIQHSSKPSHPLDDFVLSPKNTLNNNNHEEPNSIY